MYPNLKKLPSRAIIIPNWDYKKLDNRACPICGNGFEPLMLRSDNLPLAFCDKCELWYVSTPPTKEALESFYSNYYENIQPLQFSPRYFALMNKSIKKSLDHVSDIRICKLLKILHDLKNKTVLDIGCGTGEFLFLLSKMGANVIGCELSSDACDFATNYLGIKVFNESFEDCFHKIGRVDVVVLNDTFEHFLNPIRVLTLINSILNKNGYILIWTPNGGEAGKTIETALKWDGFSVDLEHMQYFSAGTINVIAKKFGYVIEHIESTGYPCLQKLKSSARTGFKKVFLELKNKLLVIFNKFALGRAIKSFLKEFVKAKDMKNGTYILFAIFRKSS